MTPRLSGWSPTSLRRASRETCFPDVAAVVLYSAPVVAAALGAPTAAMTLELDRNGVPIYSGAPDHFDEWRERALDLWWSRAGTPQQASVPILLRGGLRDLAYEAARNVPHDKLVPQDAAETNVSPKDGLDLLIETVRAALQPERPYELLKRLSSSSMLPRSGATAAKAWQHTSFDVAASLTV